MILSQLTVTIIHFICGNSTIRYPFGTCGLLTQDLCNENQIALSYNSFSYSAFVVGDITLSSYSNRTLRISPRGDSTLMSEWLTEGGFFNVSTTGWQITWSIPQSCRSCQDTGGRCYSAFEDVFYVTTRINYFTFCICPNNKLHSWNCSDGEYFLNFIS